MNHQNNVFVSQKQGNVKYKAWLRHVPHLVGRRWRSTAPAPNWKWRKPWTLACRGRTRSSRSDSLSLGVKQPNMDVLGWIPSSDFSVNSLFWNWDLALMFWQTPSQEVCVRACVRACLRAYVCNEWTSKRSWNLCFTVPWALASCL